MMARTVLSRLVLGAWSAVLLGTLTLHAEDANPESSRRPWRGWGRFGLVDVNERSHRTVLAAFRDAVHDARRSTVRVFSSDRADRPVALGTIVSADGYVFTKASELRGDLECLLSDNRRVGAVIIAQDQNYDLALLKLDVEKLEPVHWSSQQPQVGAWLATASLEADPTAIGIVSAAVRPLPHARAGLGVRLEPSQIGPRVLEVYADSAAARAALQIGDVILRLNGSSIDSPQSLTQTIRDFRPGERVELAVRRGEEEFSVITVLGELASIGNEQAVIMENLGGPLSARRSGFPVVLQHDTVLRPRECGGPLVDLDGGVVGINIARASRVASYAIPAQTVRMIFEDMQTRLAQEGSAAVLQTSATGP
jgi:serine protease Do